MHSALKNTALFTATALLLFNCEHPDTSVRTEPIKTEQIDFMGEKVIIPADFPKELFNQSQEDFSKYYNALKANSNARETGEEGGLSYEELHAILAPYIARYPDLSWEREIADQDLTRIFRDFPEITTREQVREKSEIISAYYETFVKRDITPVVVEFERKKKENGARTTSADITYTSKPEMEYLLLHPVRASFYSAAAIMAKASFNGDDGTKTNAKLHAVWTCFAIRQIILGAAVGEDNALTFVRTATSKHELNDQWIQNKTSHSAMDLHNNMSAREWMKNETKWGFGPLRKMPTDAQIINTMNDRGNSCALHPVDDILLWHGSIGSENEVIQTWNKLYNDLSSPNQHLVHVNN